MRTIRTFRAAKVAAACLLLAAILLLPLFTAAAETRYDGLVNVSRVDSKLKTEPVVVYEPDADADLAALTQAVCKPSVTILDVDEQMQVVSQNDTKSFQTVFNTYLKGRTIPALRIDSEAEADAFLSFMKNTYFIQDIFVVSRNVDLIDRIYRDETCYAVNSVYDVSDKALPENRTDFWPTIAEANMAGCNILLTNGADANVGVVATYCAALSKVCWGKVSNKTEAVGAIAGGCYGMTGNDFTVLQDAVRVFEKDGFARAQFLAAHRGITAYANENSLTALAASANEGATHVEIDLQITSDGKVILCHNSDAGATSTAPASTWVATKTLLQLRKYKLNDYSELYDETFPTLEEVIETLIDTDVIFIFELKFDNGSQLAVNTLRAIQNMYAVINRYEKMAGRWMAITFFAPYAEQMREICPEIPMGFLGFATADNGQDWQGRPGDISIRNIAGFLPFLRKYNMIPDMTLESGTYSSAQAYLVRGYVMNTWTFSDISHLEGNANIATTDRAEDCAFLVKEVCTEKTLKLTAAEIAAGKATVKCVTYNGWIYERQCDLIVVEGDATTDGEWKALLYYRQEGDAAYGVYSDLVTVRAA